MDRKERKLIIEAIDRAPLSDSDKRYAAKIMLEDTSTDITGVDGVLSGEGVAWNELPDPGEFLLNMNWYDRCRSVLLLLEWLMDWVPNMATSLDKVFGDGKQGWMIKTLKVLSRVFTGPAMVVSKGVRKMIDKLEVLTPEEKAKIEALTKKDPSNQNIQEAALRSQIRRVLLEKREIK